MALAALIAAYQEADAANGGLRATLPLAGRTLLERQARLAAAVGASPVIVFVQRLPAALVGAVDRLRAEGVSVAIARTVAEAAEAIEPGDRLLLVADGLIADQSHFVRLAGRAGPAILTVPDSGVSDRFERIDAVSRWAGLALFDGGLLQRTATMLGDWDLQSTLLRHAVQSGAGQIALRGDSTDAPLTIAERGSDLAAMESRIVEAAHAARGGWASRYLLAPIERLVTRLAMPTRVTAEWLRFGAAALTGLAAFLFARDWLWAGGLLMLVVTPLDGTADRLAALRMQDGRAPSWWTQLLPVLAAAALLAVGFSLASSHGWGSMMLAALAVAFQLALTGETRGHSLTGAAWLAERKGMTLLMLPFAFTGRWLSGLGVLAIYAMGSFFWAQREAHRPDPAKRQD